ncbi:MAG: response regulator [Chloroflexales bacterium]|nr:response regulator [Chloroflexales bacterium]
MNKRILVADDEPTVCQLLELVLTTEGYDVLIASNGDELVRTAQEQMPDLLLVDVMMPQLDGYEAIRQLRNDTRTAHLPMIILTARANPSDLVTGFETGADDYITKPFHLPELLARIKGHLRRAEQRPVHNPLTGLAGNVLLTEELKYRIRRDEPFALLHVDLDNFKAFNDIYGFSRGDRAIKLVAEVLADAVAEKGNSNDFIGHIGGDDFAVITTPATLDVLCQGVIAAFDRGVRQLYDAADLARGFLHSTDRQGVPRKFPIMTLTIGAVTNGHRHFDHYEDVSRVAAEMKGFAKTRAGSNYVVDVRNGNTSPLDGDRRGSGRPTVLLISADAELLEVRTQLKAAGLRVLEALTPLDAHALLARLERPNVVLADARLGEGLWDVCESLRSNAPDVALLVVADSDVDSVIAQSYGAALVLRHPISLESLVAQTAAHIG